MRHNTYKRMYQHWLCSTDAASRLDPCTGMELVEKVDTATWGARATEFSQFISDENGIGYIKYGDMGHKTYKSMYQIKLCFTDAASRLDPCTGIKSVEKVDTATWLACATKLRKLSRMKMESDMKKFELDESQYLSNYVPNSVVFYRCSFEAGFV
ncbi:unnamed protein product [Echinostoma caproni]|uniref:Salivary lipocalin n=1 Tax=Echinostoma caproni TaxID=27848 RepID=A0A183A051_9TREM|nr:unnamed protein product [Echinostoma caproni]